MTPQEQQMIDGLIHRVNSTNLTDKDPEAEQHLQQGFASNPNALYILSQTVLVQQYALDQARQQLDALKSQQSQSQQQAPQKHTGFLDSIFGSHSDADTRPAPPPQIQGYTPVPTQIPTQAQTYTPPPTYAPPAAYAPAPVMGGGGGFLRSAAQTAAGVAAGALAFQGVESLLHGFGNNMVGGGAGLGGFGGNEAPREEVVNNYYDNDRGNDRGFDNNNDNNPGDNLFTDSHDRSANDDTSNLADTDDDSGFDDSSNTDDSSSFDDGSSDLGNDNSF